jgi:methionyl aminopeptidase
MGLSLGRRGATIKRPEEIARMRHAGQILAGILTEFEAVLRPGVSTAELDALAEERIRSAGAIPSFLGYPSSGRAPAFPGSICASINDEVVHGIPAAGRVVREGDIVSLDIGCIWQGWHADCARTFAVGEVAATASELIAVTRRGLDAGIAEARPGRRLGDVGAAIEAVAHAAGYGVVRPFVGHGIGTEMHEEPQVPNYGRPGTGLKLEAGMCLAIEPMFNLGGDAVQMAEDGWTVMTADGSLSAHFEDTLAIGPDGAEVLTR